MLKVLLDSVPALNERLVALGCSDYVAHVDSHLPAGWVRVGDCIDVDDNPGGEGFYGPADEILATLSSAAQACVDNRQHRFLRRALRKFYRECPAKSADWPDDLWGKELVRYKSKKQFSAKNPLTLVWFDTNDGHRWVCGPHGVNCDLLAYSLVNQEYYCSREEALLPFSGKIL